MNIIEATKKSLETGSWIFRTSNANVGYLPTNSTDCYYLRVLDHNEKPIGKCWNPQADDIMADDFEIVGVVVEEKDKNINANDVLAELQAKCTKNGEILAEKVEHLADAYARDVVIASCCKCIVDIAIDESPTMSEITAMSSLVDALHHYL